DASAQNADAIANIGFIVGRDGVLVTETGGSLADGQWLRAEIAKRTDKPIRHVVLSHVHPDHCFGAAAFLEDKPNFIGHASLREA
ncbi:MBL fold metallo-hydrolase, partial [Stenotrophomonas maltophilia]